MAGYAKNRGKVRLYQRLIRIAHWIASLPNRVTPPPFRLLQISSAYWHSRALYVAARLGVADTLGEGERPVGQIAQSLGLHEDHLYRLMRMLASIGVFRETDARVFGNSPISAHLRADHPHSLRALVLMHHSPALVRPWVESLEEGIRSGETPFVRTHGVELFDYMDRHPDFDRLFAEAMDAVEALTGDAYLQDFDWSRFDRLIDVGGSNGAKSLAILARQPHLRALVFDRPQVVAQAREAWQGRIDPSVLARIEFAGGDMRQTIPEPRSDRDLYLFMAIFHGMGEDDGHRVLTALRQAIGTHRSAVLVVDMVAQAKDIDPSIAAFDMQMLVGTRGRERTREEWAALFAGAGFEIEEIVAVRSFPRFIVVRPTSA